MSRTQPPRDAITATDLWVPVDATGEDFYALGNYADRTIMPTATGQAAAAPVPMALESA